MIERQRVTRRYYPLITQVAPATYERLRRLAFDERISIAELVRRAVRQVYGEPPGGEQHGG